MADSVDRVFVQALNTVKKIPKTGASRPPPGDRLKLYGLYKQAMEGDVDGVMERPSSVGEGDEDPEDIKKDRDKFDAWDAQKGITRTEAKRRYIEALIETMHRYASTTADARALVDELEFVWDQIKHNSISSSGSFPAIGGVPSHTAPPRQFQQPMSGNDGPLRILSPMSQDDEADMRSERHLDFINDFKENDDYNDDGKSNRSVKRWQEKVEQALMKMTAEIAALREHIATGKEYQGRKRRSPARWVGWMLWIAIRHFMVDFVVLGIMLLWMRRRKEKRIEDLVRQGLAIARGYLGMVLPTR